ncbi:MbtH family protein [Streptomyces lucensis JCM 4490]|uniref:MbtH family protein n=1 Tax=Streptomyces lucensis JCM 4490 TaxID=1306176 RepID=A0A918J9W2_9ACTN|nr:MbtH family NRPS accessory protein [Streptomyces lucensis]GGW63048.1 MbtH family protein [Streptomyces lucensis JCM 4490]
MFTDEKDAFTYVVVVNHEEQYSIWPQDKETPRGWRATDKAGAKDECLEHIRKVWTDMRPLSLRKQMERGGEADGERA